MIVGVSVEGSVGVSVGVSGDRRVSGGVSDGMSGDEHTQRDTYIRTRVGLRRNIFDVSRTAAIREACNWGHVVRLCCIR